jgi:hypothetical protein
MKKEQKVISPFFTMARLKKVLIKGKYVQLSNIKGLFSLTPEQENLLLSKAMKLFWAGEFNLFCVPELSELCRFKSIIAGKKDCSIQIITREVFRSSLIPYINGKKRCLKKPDLVNNRLEIADDEDDFYKTFQNETWEFYRRIFNRLKREYCQIATNAEASDIPLNSLEELLNSCGGDFRDLSGTQRLSALALLRGGRAPDPVIPDPQLNHLYEKFGQPLCKHNHDCDPGNLMLKLGGAKWSLLQRLSSLCLEYCDLLKMLGKNHKEIFSEQTPKDVEDSLYCWDSKHDQALIKNGYDLDNEFIFNRYFELKNNNPSWTEIHISKQLYKVFSKNTTMPTPSRIRRIIHEVRNREIRNHFILWLKGGSKDSYIEKLAQDLFTTSKHIKKIFEDEEKNREIMNYFILWLEDGSKDSYIEKLAQDLFTTSKHIKKIFEEEHSKFWTKPVHSAF